MCRRGENIYKRKDGRWEGRLKIGIRANGKPKFRSFYASSYTKVKKRLEQEKAQTLLHCQPNAPIQEQTLRQWAAYWLNDVKKPVVRASTFENYRRILDKHLLPAFGERNIREITQEIIKSQLCAWRNTYASSTVQSIFRILRCMLQSAHALGLCADLFIGLRVYGKCAKPRVLSLDEQKKLEQTVSGSLRVAALLCLYTGLRVGELCALEWEDIDWSRKTIHINKSVQRLYNQKRQTELVVGKPKSESSIREIPLASWLHAFMRDAYQDSSKSGYIFSGRPLQCLDPRTLQSQLARVTKALDLAGVHMHTLRHTFATRCLEQNIGIELVSELLGHSSVQVTMDYYTHSTMERMRNNMNKLKQLV